MPTRQCFSTARDERLKDRSGMSGALKAFPDRVQSGDLGSLPVVVGLVVIWTVFQTFNPVFLSPRNLVNLLFDCSTVGIISLGIVCVLIVGEIDLSVGSVSGLSSAILGVLWVRNDWPPALAILAALAAGCLIGWMYAQLYNRLGMPSFVSTLAGLLAFLGLQLYILGPNGSINLPYESRLVRFGELLVMPIPVAYALAAVPGAAHAGEPLPHGKTAPSRWTVLPVSGRAAAGGGPDHRRARGERLLPQLRPRRAVDVRPLCWAGHGYELCAAKHQMGPLDVRRRRQPSKRRDGPASTSA